MEEQGFLKYRIHLKAGLRVKDEYFVPGGEMLVHLPIPKESSPAWSVRMLNTGHRPFATSPADAPARTSSFLERLDKNDTFWVEYEYISHIIYQKPDPDRVSDSLPSFDTQPQPPHIRFTPYLRALAERIVGTEANPLKMCLRDSIHTHQQESLPRRIGGRCHQKHAGQSRAYAGRPCKTESKSQKQCHKGIHAKAIQTERQLSLIHI